MKAASRKSSYKLQAEAKKLQEENLLQLVANRLQL
ncbi:hypothetical protein PSYMO_00620 [Pseudomonas amygdali pv. mori str. 301020]|uniref:Uncharacterized protein n=1 Tax=Pseudomonas amygdali pv. mori str. 301020 TaxID=629261 RepID=A0A656G1T7_PSEA0|nr:hypothetical protein PSYMO_00620 [Pseudomonas amygdali pv. mori str. 301020]